MTIDGKEFKVKDLMRPVVILHEDAELKEVLEALVREKSNIAVVVDGEGVFVGGVNTIDVIRAILPDYLEKDKAAAHFADTALLREDTLKASTKSICEFVDKNDVTVRPDVNLLEATVITTMDSLGRIIVLDEGNKPVGILTRTEIKQVLAAFLGIKNDLRDLCEGKDCK